MGSAEVWLAMVRLLLTLLILWQNSQESFASKENWLDMRIGKLYQTYAQSNTLLKEMAPTLLKEMKHSKKAFLLREKNAELQDLLFNLLNSRDDENFAPWGGKRR